MIVWTVWKLKWIQSLALTIVLNAHACPLLLRFLLTAGQITTSLYLSPSPPKTTRCHSIMSVQITSPNGTRKAERRRFADLDRKFRGNPEFCVATIDYGTTHCSVSYTLYPGEKLESVLVTLDQTKGLYRVPNCILFDDLGHRMAFGYDAREKYHKLDSQKVKKWFYFEHVKKTFQHVVSTYNIIVHVCNGYTLTVDPSGVKEKDGIADIVSFSSLSHRT